MNQQIPITNNAGKILGHHKIEGNLIHVYHPNGDMKSTQIGDLPTDFLAKRLLREMETTKS